MTSIGCLTCIHFHHDDEKAETCDAFPNGIPEEIFLGEVSHNSKVDGDDGIQWKPIPSFQWMESYIRGEV